MSDVGLYLADGTSWPGVSVGAPGAAVGEAVFTTAMTGYQEALTDPSFARQILTFTAPMIGNYGVEDAASESRRVQATALICHEARNYAPNGRDGPARLAARRRASSRSRASTRARWCATCATAARCSRVACGEGVSRDEALALLAAEPPMAGRLLADEVSGELDGLPQTDARCHVVVLDYGAKASIVRLLEQAGARRHGAARTTRRRRRSTRSRPTACCSRTGPATPARWTRTSPRCARWSTRDARSTASASATSCSAARSGWRRSSCRSGTAAPTTRSSRRASGRVLVTSQNHGFAVRAPENGDGALEVTHRSLYDGTVEGLRLRGRPVWSMQFHPEASPGPHDAREKLAEFVEACAARAGGSG